MPHHIANAVSLLLTHSKTQRTFSYQTRGYVVTVALKAGIMTVVSMQRGV